MQEVSNLTVFSERQSGRLAAQHVEHQALGDVAKSLEVVTRSGDGIIEAVYAPNQSHAVGTQWHPERLAARDEKNQALFDDLVEAAKAFESRK